jgi:hypothetical protein
MKRSALVPYARSTKDSDSKTVACSSSRMQVAMLARQEELPDEVAQVFQGWREAGLGIKGSDDSAAPADDGSPLLDVAEVVSSSHQT